MEVDKKGQESVCKNKKLVCVWGKHLKTSLFPNKIMYQID